MSRNPDLDLLGCELKVWEHCLKGLRGQLHRESTLTAA